MIDNLKFVKNRNEQNFFTSCEEGGALKIIAYCFLERSSTNHGVLSISVIGKDSEPQVVPCGLVQHLARQLYFHHFVYV